MDALQVGSRSVVAAGLLLVFAAGCRSPYYADQGALFGGLTGAGVGALVGNAVGSTGAGAAIGAGVGALSGAAIGDGLDEIEARNRAQIQAQLGRQVAAGAVTIPDVVAMSQSGVDPELIVTHIRAHGMAQTLQAGDLIYLQQQGVPTRVIQAMQTPSAGAVPAAAGPPVVVAPPPVYVADPYWYPPPPYWYYRGCPPRRGVSWGIAVGR